MVIVVDNWVDHEGVDVDLPFGAPPINPRSSPHRRPFISTPMASPPDAIIASFNSVPNKATFIHNLRDKGGNNSELHGDIGCVG
jgi:hypothetical protein